MIRATFGQREEKPPEEDMNETKNAIAAKILNSLADIKKSMESAKKDQAVESPSPKPAQPSPGLKMHAGLKALLKPSKVEEVVSPAHTGENYGLLIEKQNEYNAINYKDLRRQ